jgi:F-type H+-transporting ATPase subunit alpha
VIQIFAATNGYLDRITVDKVQKFLGDLAESVRGNNEDLLKKIADDDWSDEVQDQAHEAVKQFAEDFGFDLDEEGQPLEEDEDGGDSNRSQSDSGDSDDSGDGDSEDDEDEAKAA